MPKKSRSDWLQALRAILNKPTLTEVEALIASLRGIFCDPKLTWKEKVMAANLRLYMDNKTLDNAFPSKLRQAYDLGLLVGGEDKKTVKNALKYVQNANDGLKKKLALECRPRKGSGTNDWSFTQATLDRLLANITTRLENVKREKALPKPAAESATRLPPSRPQSTPRRLRLQLLVPTPLRSPWAARKTRMWVTSTPSRASITTAARAIPARRS
jgi:hypothetical protein